MPTFPTDNLYKLMTIVGAALLAFATWTMQYDGLREDQFFAPATARQLIIEGRLATLGVAVPQDQKGKRDPEQLYQFNLEQIWKLASSPARDAIFELNEKLYLDRLHHLEYWNRYYAYYIFLIIMGVGGITIMVFGLVRWLLRVQLLQDQLLIEEVRRAMNRPEVDRDSAANTPAKPISE